MVNSQIGMTREKGTVINKSSVTKKSQMAPAPQWAQQELQAPQQWPALQAPQALQALQVLLRWRLQGPQDPWRWQLTGKGLRTKGLIAWPAFFFSRRKVSSLPVLPLQPNAAKAAEAAIAAEDTKSRKQHTKRGKIGPKGQTPNGPAPHASGEDPCVTLRDLEHTIRLHQTLTQHQMAALRPAVS